MRKFTAVNILFLVFTVSVFGAKPLNIPGFIPLNGPSKFSSDLLFEGELIGEFDFENKQALGLDASELEPQSKYLLKNPQQIGDVLLNEDSKEFYFSGSIRTPKGEHWFGVDSPDNINYEILLSNKNHNYLVRTALLSLLGYKVPKAKWYKEVQINFNSKDEVDEFLYDMKVQTLQIETDDLKKLWVTEVGDKHVKLRDVVMTEFANGEFNPAGGLIYSDKAKDKRALNALLVPYTFADIPSSINSLNWSLGSLIENHYVLNYYLARSFSTTKGDLYWMANKLAKLNRDDIVQIVEFAKYPIEVKKILVEKLISRRDSLIKDLKLDFELGNPDTKISHKPILKDGKLIEEEIDKVKDKEPYKFYASNFVFGDFENPITLSKAYSYFKAEGISSGLTYLLDAFHNEFPIGTDISAKLGEEYKDAVFRHLVNFVETGEAQEFNVGTVTVPYVGFNLHGSRDVIIGGKNEENISLMLSQSFGYSIGAGVFGITDSVGSRLSLRGNVEARIQRMFSNLRPLSDVDQLNEQPLMDILVNFHKSSLVSDLEEHVSETKVEDTKEFLKTLKENLAMGESLVITDSLNFSGQSSAFAPINPTIVIGNNLFKNNAIARRTNIVRSGENTLQIYRGLSDLDAFSFGISGYALNIPTVSFSWSDMVGEMDTNIYEININTATSEELLAFLSFFKENDTRYLRESFYKGKIKHKYEVDTSSFSFFWWRNSKSEGENSIELSNTKGWKANILRKFNKSISGKNLSFFVSSFFNLLYEDRTFDSYHLEGLLSKIVEKFGKDDYSVKIEYQDYNERSKDFFWTDNGFMQIHYNWNGFRDSADDLKEKMTDFNNEFDEKRTFFPVKKLDNTSSVLYYNMNVFFNIYKGGIKRLLNLKKSEFADTFAKYKKSRRKMPNHKKCRNGNLYRYEEPIKACYFLIYDYYVDVINDEDLPSSERTEKLIDFITYLKNRMKLEGLMSLLGKDHRGGYNYYIYGSLNGIRYGDERGLVDSISANTIGNRNGLYPFGPLQYIHQESGINFSELYLNGL